MATLCIILRDNLRPGHPSPHTAARPGDVVAVYGDAVVPGTKTVASPDFALVRLPRVSRARLEFLLDPVVSDLTDAQQIPTVYRRRRFLTGLLTRDQLDKAKASALVYDTAGDDFERDAVRDHVEDKATGRTLRDDGVTI